MTALIIVGIVVAILVLSLLVPPTRRGWGWLLVRSSGTTVRTQKSMRRPT